MTSNHRTIAAKDQDELLEELRSLGFSWRVIARIAQMSVPELRNWRRVGLAAAENRRRIVEIVALCRRAREDHVIDDIAAWLETPLHSEVPITGLELLAAERSDLVLRLLCRPEESPEQILDEFEPGWREHYASSVEVFTAPDGLPGLRFVG